MHVSWYKYGAIFYHDPSISVRLVDTERLLNSKTPLLLPISSGMGNTDSISIITLFEVLRTYAQLRIGPNPDPIPMHAVITGVRSDRWINIDKNIIMIGIWVLEYLCLIDRILICMHIDRDRVLRSALKGLPFPIKKGCPHSSFRAQGNL